MPTDLDFNGHMTNNRYHTIMDYAALRVFGSHGILSVMLKNRWRPIVGCSLISHRKSLKIFDRCTVRSEIIYCDDIWSYLTHIIEYDGQIVAAANRKYALLGRRRLIKISKVFSATGADFNNKPSNIAPIQSWVDAEATVLSHSKIGNAEPQQNKRPLVMECKKELADSLLCQTSNNETAMPCLYAGLECAEQAGCPTQKN
jgi:acyl-CoA thioesterase FadM